MERIEDMPVFREIPIESFGENLTKLTEEVFGNREINKYYKKVIDKIAEEAQTYETALKTFQENSIELSLNSLFYLKSKFN